MASYTENGVRIGAPPFYPNSMCSMCGVNKKHVTSSGREITTCRDCNNKYYKRKAYHLKNRYGLTHGDYEKLYKEQQGLCAICKNPPKLNQVLVVDHNHQSGLVRGLLCQSCNKGLGHFRDNLEILTKAVQYLNKENE